MVRERRRVDVLPQFTSGRDPSAPPLIPGSRGLDETRYMARPFVDAGFKWFVSESAFIRSEVTTSISGRGFAQTAWSTGVGVEF